MIDNRFFIRNGLETIDRITVAAKEKGAIFTDIPQGGRIIAHVATLKEAGAEDLSFFENAKYRDDFLQTEAGFCISRPGTEAVASANCILLLSPDPYSAYALCAEVMYDNIGAIPTAFEEYRVYNGAYVAKDARLEEGIALSPGVMIGARAEIGSGTVLHSHVSVGAGCTIGRDCEIFAGVSVTHALIGDRVRLSYGARIGQEGFGFAPGKKHISVPQLGRVILQDSVEIGANSAVDRGAISDTVIGEGTKIDNLVQIGHNVRIGRHCLIAGQTAIAGSVVMEDYVMCGGQTCIAGHLTVGAQARISGGASVMHHVPAKEVWGGAPAQLIHKYFKEVALLRKMAQKGEQNT